MLVEGFFPRVRVGREADQPAVGLSGVWSAVRPRCGDHALLGRVPDRPSARGDGGERGTRSTTTRPGPTSCCSTAACSSLRCFAIGCWKCWEVGSISQTSRARIAGGQRPAVLGSRSSWTTIGSIWPSPAARPTTAWCGGEKAFASPPAWPARIISGWNRGRKPVPRPQSGGVPIIFPLSSLLSPLSPCFCHLSASRPELSRATTWNWPTVASICWCPNRRSSRCSFPARG